jgi:hypothetical protein
MSQSLPRIAFFAIASQRPSERDSYSSASIVCDEMDWMMAALRGDDLLFRDHFTCPWRAFGHWQT